MDFLICYTENRIDFIKSEWKKRGQLEKVLLSSRQDKIGCGVGQGGITGQSELKSVLG